MRVLALIHLSPFVGTTPLSCSVCGWEEACCRSKLPICWIATLFLDPSDWHSFLPLYDSIRRVLELGQHRTHCALNFLLFFFSSTKIFFGVCNPPTSQWPWWSALLHPHSCPPAWGRGALRAGGAAVKIYLQILERKCCEINNERRKKFVRWSGSEEKVEKTEHQTHNKSTSVILSVIFGFASLYNRKIKILFYAYEPIL